MVRVLSRPLGARIFFAGWCFFGNDCFFDVGVFLLEVFLGGSMFFDGHGFWRGLSSVNLIADA